MFCFCPTAARHTVGLTHGYVACNSSSYHKLHGRGHNSPVMPVMLGGMVRQPGHCSVQRATSVASLWSVAAAECFTTAMMFNLYEVLPAVRQSSHHSCTALHTMCLSAVWPTPWVLRARHLQIDALQQEIDACVKAAFENITVTLPAEQQPDGEQQPQQEQTYTFKDLNDAAFAVLGRDNPKLLMALLEAAQSADKAAWTAFQADIQTLKLKRQRLTGQLADARSLLDAAEREASKRQGLAAAADTDGRPITPLTTNTAVRPVRIVLICGFESFNVALYNAAAKRLAGLAPHIQLRVFSDRDISTRREAVAGALAGADCFFGSLLFDYDTVEWLREQIKAVPVVLVFESALELMGMTRLGTFTMDPSGKACAAVQCCPEALCWLLVADASSC